ncbi:hypothetical protein ATANTOWER_006602 [Ataeniobius toweri]|uniref:Uncharacterized protein n=1 Tax=Ataeniobius toweri TaxID=208326 RepID=A0ABU7BY47_9TELE|nr:hypothetical protein [Ataeniobius toweri]
MTGGSSPEKDQASEPGPADLSCQPVSASSMRHRHLRRPPTMSTATAELSKSAAAVGELSTAAPTAAELSTSSAAKPSGPHLGQADRHFLDQLHKAFNPFKS